MATKLEGGGRGGKALVASLTWLIGSIIEELNWLDDQYREWKLTDSQLTDWLTKTDTLKNWETVKLRNWQTLTWQTDKTDWLHSWTPDNLVPENKNKLTTSQHDNPTH